MCEWRRLPAYFFNLLKYRRLTLEKLASPAGFEPALPP